MYKVDNSMGISGGKYWYKYEEDEGGEWDNGNAW